MQVGFDYHLVNGDTRTTPPTPLAEDVVTVNDPSADALLIDLIPVFPAGSVRTVFADLLYEDADEHYRREAHVEFDGADPQRASLRIALFDPAKRTYTLTYTILGLDGSIRRLDERADEQRIFVGETF
jgi:hypothetical protein